MKYNYNFENMKKIPNKVVQRLGTKAKPALIDKSAATAEELQELQLKLQKLSPEDRKFYEECCDKKYVKDNLAAENLNSTLDDIQRVIDSSIIKNEPIDFGPIYAKLYKYLSYKDNLEVLEMMKQRSSL